MSGRPDPATARWAEADVPPGGEPDGSDASVGSASVGDVLADAAAGDEASAADDPLVAGVAAGDSAGTILTDVAALAAERDDYLQSLQRLKADFDNYRKRVARLQEEQAGRAAAALVQKLLPVLDNLDLAVAHLVHDEPATENSRALAKARDQLLDVLVKEGLERVDATEIPFDPTVHDAVAHAEPAAQAEPAAHAESAAHPEPAAPGGTPAAPGGTPAEPGGTPAEPGGTPAEPGGTPAEPEPAAPVATSAPAPGASPDPTVPAPDRVAARDGSDDAPAAAAKAHEVMVDEVMRAGYRWRGHVLRPAMVRVRG